jgi:hypothetical protein
LVALLFATLPAAADTLTLKDGTVLEGKILKKEADVYVIEYKVNKSGSIKDIKRVPRSQIERVVEIRPDEEAFAKLATLVPTPDLLSAEDYAARIQSVREFLAKYPDTLKKKEADVLAEKLAAEAKIIEAGGRKLDGQLISGEEWRANAYDLDARTVERKIRDALKANRTLDVLRAFAELEAEFQPSASFRTMVPIVVAVMKNLRKKVEISLGSFEARMEKQASDLDGMGAARDSVKRAIEQKQAALEARYQAEKAANQQWVTPSPDHRQSLEDCASVLDSELSRLADEIPAPAVDPGKAYRDAWRAIRTGKEAAEVEKAYEAAQAGGLPERYLKLLQEAGKAKGFKLGTDS